MEQDKEQLNITSFDLILLINEIVDYFKDEAEKKGVELVKEIPEAELVVIPKASHKLPYENPRMFFRKCIEFYQDYGLVTKRRPIGTKNVTVKFRR